MSSPITIWASAPAWPARPSACCNPARPLPRRPPGASCSRPAAGAWPLGCRSGRPRPVRPETRSWPAWLARPQSRLIGLCRRTFGWCSAARGRTGPGGWPRSGWPADRPGRPVRLGAEPPGADPGRLSCRGLAAARLPPAGPPGHAGPAADRSRRRRLGTRARAGRCRDAARRFPPCAGTRPLGRAPDRRACRGLSPGPDSPRQAVASPVRSAQACRFGRAPAWPSPHDTVVAPRAFGHTSAWETSHVGRNYPYRNVALVGPNGSGKSSLFESLLFVTGQIGRKKGSHDGAGADAKASGQGAELAVATIAHEDGEITLLDCPGSIEFACETRNGLIGVDAAILVIEPLVERVVALTPAPFPRSARHSPSRLRQQDGPLGRALP